MNYRTANLLDKLDDLVEAAYDTGWLAGAIEAGRKDIDQQMQEAKISQRNALKYWLDTQIKELGEALEEQTK